MAKPRREGFSVYACKELSFHATSRDFPLYSRDLYNNDKCRSSLRAPLVVLIFAFLGRNSLFSTSQRGSNHRLSLYTITITIIAVATGQGRAI
jgi:hypothetical protein